MDLETILVIHPLQILDLGMLDGWTIRMEWRHMFAHTSFKFDVPIPVGVLPPYHVDNPMTFKGVGELYHEVMGEVYLPFVEAWKAQDPAVGKAAFARALAATPSPT